MKRIILGADLLCQNSDVHLQQILKNQWSRYMKIESLRAAIAREYELSLSALQISRSTFYYDFLTDRGNDVMV